jgi:hypothetical protein
LNPISSLATLTLHISLPMHLFNSLPLADIPFNITLLIVAALIIGLAVVICGLYFQNRRREMWHERVRIALEKGQPLPPSVEEETPSPKASKNEAADDIRSGLICVGVGGGLYLFLGAIGGQALGYVGAIPGFVGIALLLFGLIRLAVGRKGPSDDHARRS